MAPKTYVPIIHGYTPPNLRVKSIMSHIEETARLQCSQIITKNAMDDHLKAKNVLDMVNDAEAAVCNALRVL